MKLSHYISPFAQHTYAAVQNIGDEEKCPQVGQGNLIAEQEGSGGFLQPVFVEPQRDAQRACGKFLARSLLRLGGGPAWKVGSAVNNPELYVIHMVDACNSVRRLWSQTKRTIP